MPSKALLEETTWEDRLRTALDKADPNVLRMVLYHLTGDDTLANMQLDVKLERGGVYRTSVLCLLYTSPSPRDS